MCSGTIWFLHKHFPRLGIPDTNVLKNGRQFMVKEFKDSCKAFLIIHIPTASYHPWPNGQAERFVDTFKWALKPSDGNKSTDNIL